MSSEKDKKCFILGCETSAKISPKKLFLYVPRQPERRKKWFQVARRKLTTNDAYCCENHFQLQEDATNWVKYQNVPGTKLILKPHVVPHALLTPRKRKCPSQLSDSARKRRDANANLFRSSRETPPENHGEQHRTVVVAGTTPLSSSEVNHPQIPEGKRSKRKQLLIPTADFDLFRSSRETPPKNHGEQHQTVVVAGTTPLSSSEVNHPQVPEGKRSKRKQLLLSTADFDVEIVGPDEQPDDYLAFPLPIEDSVNDSLHQPFEPSKAPAPQPPHSPTTSTSSISELPSTTSLYDETDFPSSSSLTHDELAGEELKRLSGQRQIMLLKLEPRFYLGIPESEMSVISTLSCTCGMSERDVMLTIKKLRTDDVFARIGHDFGITMQRSAQIFRDSLPIMSAWLASFIYWPSSQDIRLRLPMQFRKRFANVESIIDCFEVEIEKPSNAKHQALTWSRYKGCNTVKVLISSTPNGYINFISKAYGGRISDIKICSVSGYLNALPDGCSVLADRGFKQLESDLARKSCVLIRPASVAADGQMSHEDVVNTRRIASVRIHIERVISRVREFRFLDIHSRIDCHLLDLIDHAIVVVCALVNVQGPLIQM